MSSAGLSRKEIAAMLALIVIAASISAYIYSLDRSDDEEIDPTAIEWEVSVVGDNYRIDIIDVQSALLDEVSWSILSTHPGMMWEDPAGDILRFEGDLSDINFSQADYDKAAEKEYGLFYSRDPEGDPPFSQNLTLCIVYVDNDIDGKLSDGDQIWLRSIDNGGAADEDFRFRMYNERVDNPYGELFLPAI